MAKRRANAQITRDHGEERDGSSSSEEELDQKPAVASAATLAQRKIAVPRARRAPGAAAAPAPGAGTANPFAAFAKPSPPAGGVPTGSTGEKPAIFSFGAAAAKASEPSSKPAVSFGTAFSGNTGLGFAGGSVASTHTSAQLRMRGLNAAFAAQIAKANTASPFEDWSEMCRKYISYVEKATKDSSDEKVDAKPVSGAAPAAANGSDTGAKKSEGGSQITASGFKFGGSTGPATSFQFGDKKVEIKKSEKSSAAAGGFVFNPKGNGEIKSGTPPAANTSRMSDDDADDSTSNAKSGDTTMEEAPKPAFSFGKPAESKPAESKPAFSFGQPSEKATEKPAFSFGKPSQEPKSESKPLFSFNKPAEGSAKPAFSFGTPAGDSAKPAAPFSFGKPAGEESKPLFGFGKPAEKPAADQDASSQPAGDKPAGDKPVFSFGSSAGSDKSAGDKPAFTFGSAGSAGSASGDSKPKFTFGQTNSDSKPAFTFGSNSESKPAFTFGQQSSNKSGLAFGASANPFSNNNGDAKIDATWKPTTPIKIAGQSEAASGANDAGADASKPGEPSDTPNDPQTDLGGPGPGEEDEDSIYEKKSKAFELVSGEYKQLGLGMLRVLKHRENGKVRALLRAEGSGRVLLNIPIRKEFSYTVVGKGQVKLLDVKPDNDSPTVYLVRVKTEEDGNELRDKLEANKA